MVSPKEDLGYLNERGQTDRYYDDRASHCYREIKDERDSSVNSSLNNSGSLTRRSQEPSDPERGEINSVLSILGTIFVLIIVDCFVIVLILFVFLPLLFFENSICDVLSTILMYFQGRLMHF